MKYRHLAKDYAIAKELSEQDVKEMISSGELEGLEENGYLFVLSDQKALPAIPNANEDLYWYFVAASFVIGIASWILLRGDEDVSKSPPPVPAQVIIRETPPEVKYAKAYNELRKRGLSGKEAKEAAEATTTLCVIAGGRDCY